MSVVVEVERTVNAELGWPERPNQFLRTIRRAVKEAKAADGRLEDCQLYDIGFKREQDCIRLRLYFTAVVKP